MPARPPEQPLLSRVLLPIASAEDAEATADAALGHIADATGEVRAIYVVEKAGGAPDKAGVEQREAHAEEAFEVLADRAEGAGVPVSTTVVYDTDVVDAILEAASAWEATAIAYTPRGGSRLAEFLSGDLGSALVRRTDLPVIVFPKAGGETE
jgi:nucleotide-binding universal stress UspA family protein